MGYGFTGLHCFTWFTLLTPLHSLRLGVYGFTRVHLLHIVHMVYITSLPPLPAHGFTGLRNYGCTLVHTESQWVYWFTLVYMGYIVDTLTWFAFRGLRVYTRPPPSHCSHGLHNPPPPDGITGLHTLTSSTLFTWLANDLSGREHDVNLKNHFASQYIF